MPTDTDAQFKKRPPVVVVMGHVDHGKTTLLDYIRKTNVAGREAGGITQAIGAYEIIHAPHESMPAEGSEGSKITFIDTPGHEAFTAMRTRGAHVADLAILVVAADDGVKPQTEEAVKIIKESKTPFLVAINKIDKPNANIEKVKSDLLTAGVLLEGYGGNVSYELISAKSGEGVEKLLDLVLLAAEIEHLTYDPKAAAKGFVLEARQNPKRGIEAAVVVTDGTLRRGWMIRTESAQGKVKILDDFLGKPATELFPSSPAVVVGFESLPKVGEEFTEGAGEEIQKTAAGAAETKEAIDENALRIILKASDSGSLEALHQIVVNIPQENKIIAVVGESIGDITEADTKLAVATGAIVAGFGVKADKSAKNISEAHRVPIITSPVIYELVKMIGEALAGGIKKESGALEVLAVFNQKKLSEQLVGGALREGKLKIKMRVAIVRGGAEAGQGRIMSIREKKNDLTEAAAPIEVGLVINSETKIEIGDRIVAKE